MKKVSSALCLLASALVLGGCSHNKWKVEGTIASADAGSTIVLEAPDNAGGWKAVDTLAVDRNGRFSLKGESIGRPEVYRLTFNGQSLYFPIDSTETVKVTANACDFATSYTLSGSDSAEKMQAINDMINKVVSQQGEQAVAYDPDLKRQLSEAILRQPDGVVAYYTIFRRVGNTLIFDPAERSDLRIIGAVANAFNTSRPDDPRTKFLADLFMANRRSAGVTLPTDTLAAVEISLPPLSLLDENGKQRNIEQIASQGKVVVINFIDYNQSNSPAVNMELRKIYDAYKGRGLEIYQVGVDDDEFSWRQSAKNLPWITVYNLPSDGAQALLNYNIQALPSSFVVNRKGELVERIDNISRLEGAINRYL